jgi:hypothetical protein
MSEEKQEIADLDEKKLELERFKAQLDYRKAIVISGYAAIAITLIPALFQLATAALEC